MKRFDVYLLVLGRVLISVVFILNALGIIDQSIPAHEMVERGAPPSLVPAMMMAGRAVELLAGLGLIWESSRALQLWRSSRFSCRRHSFPTLFGSLPEHLRSWANSLIFRRTWRYGVVCSLLRGAVASLRSSLKARMLEPGEDERRERGGIQNCRFA